MIPVYFVAEDKLWVTHCDARRRLVEIGTFRDRLDLNRRTAVQQREGEAPAEPILAFVPSMYLPQSRVTTHLIESLSENGRARLPPSLLPCNVPR